MGQGVAGYVAQTLKPLIVKDAQHDSRFNKDIDTETGFVTRSILCIPLVTKGECLGVLEVINKVDNTLFCDADLELLSTLGTQISSAIDNANMYGQMKSLFLSTVQSLSSAIDAKNKYTNDHSRRVTIYSLAIAQEMGCTVEVCNNIRLSGLLHDIGKIGVPEAILDKSSRLTDEEFKKIKEHPMIGARIMEPIKPLQKIIPGMRYHHERWDGRGYPDGLQGLEIPLAGRIIAVADTFDAMTSDRSYRKGLSAEIAIKEIKNCSGTQFDPTVVKAFLQAYEKNNIRVLS
jgi:putative nucleotidyltransferase with HDIG domain